MRSVCVNRFNALIKILFACPVTVFFNIIESEITFTGPGTIEFVESSAGKYEININGAGVYFITASVVGPGPDDSEVTYEDTVAVEVLDKAVIDAKLKGKWDAMKAKLSIVDIENGIKYFTAKSQGQYQETFNAISDVLPQAIAEMQGIEMIYCKNGTAKYRITSHQLIDKVYRDITYYIYFLIDDDGIWKIDRF